MKRLTKAILTSSLAVALLAGSCAGMSNAHAAGSKDDISIIVNNEMANVDVTPYIRDGATLVPLNAIKTIPDVQISWNNNSKIVTVNNSGQKSTLKAGSTTATIIGHQVKLTSAAEMKNGRIIVPIRFITSAADAYAYWNAEQHAVYVAKPSATLAKQLQSSDTATARNAAIRFPAVDKTGTLLETPETGDNMLYTTYFPKNKVDEFFKQHMDIVNYYRIINNHAELLWSAKVDLKQQVKNTNLPIVPYKIIDSKGKMPSIPTGGVYFAFSLPGAFHYGIIDKNGKMTELPTATPEQSQQGIFNIPEEEQLK
ncbi:copper amine oxidase N-terminal domain-containing protein [Paenibacillus shenyangensis]|uniref:copper amine oxidase N-terminal domain-containing protein n=1 Tax=Paenibacillus sp. A9 TaxID=1284352 RepID=UPI00037F35B3|nr:copper amine oxidase N-terminal domain-containing protein [Paenibacillus sp. A9]